MKTNVRSWRVIPPALGTEIEEWFAAQTYERRQFALSVAVAIKKARREVGLTQLQLATIIGSTQPSLSRLERGYLTDVGIQMLQRIGSALGKEAKIVFGPTGSQDTPGTR